MSEETRPTPPHVYRYPSPDLYRLRPSSSSLSPQPNALGTPSTTRRKLTGPNYLQNILNSDSEPEVETSPSTSPGPRRRYLGLHSPPLQQVARPLTNGAAEYLRNQLCLPPGLPVDLWAIADPPDGQKPFASIPTLVKLAIHGSRQKRLTLQGICDALIERFTWFNNHRQDDAWKNSVRHNLSLNKVFRKIPRDVTQLGKGCYWELDLSNGEGHKRPRKRRSKWEKNAAGSDHEEVESIEESAENTAQLGGPSLQPLQEERESSLVPYSPPPEQTRRQSQKHRVN
ncbi:fork head domain-containing protein [Mycena crocata]|nr:fork head domain-containing protein [Mycena crocata]